MWRAVEHWSCTTGALFHTAPYHQVPDSLGRVRAYLAARKSLIRGAVASSTRAWRARWSRRRTLRTSAIRHACADSIFGHAGTLVADFAAAMKERGVEADVTAESLAAHTQCVLQGAFVLAGPRGDAWVAVESIEHLERYIELLFGEKPKRRRKLS